MGQNLDTMRQKQSKDELLYKAAIAGNVDGIRALCREGGNAGTLLHHAAKTGLEQTVKLLLDIFHAFNWVVIIPCGSSRPPKFELAIYSTLQVRRPLMINLVPMQCF
ncbi:hypothetical protein V6N13_071578 [Hibiscus sabdariffa]